jgi:TolB-like protein
VLAAALLACRGAPPRPEPEARRFALFPVQNASGGNAPIRGLTEALDAALAARGLAVVPRQELDAALADHRIRFTGGVDRTLARVLRDDLGVEAVLIPTLEQYSGDAPPRISLSWRLVAAADRPVVLWADGLARSGDDAPGLLGRGRVTVAAELERLVVVEVARAVERRLTARAQGEWCGGAGRFGPRRTFRAPVLDDVGRRSIAVLPFTNLSARRSASDVLVAQFVGGLARSGAFEVLDPGLVREELLGHRIVLTGGVSIDQATALLDLLGADLVLSGTVEVYEASAGRGAPSVEFTAYVLDRRTTELVWSSTSHGSGDDGVFFFDAGRVRTSAALSCRMARGVVDALVGHRSALPPAG